MKLTRRLSWGVADQACSSVSNFALSAFVAANVSVGEFGAFSLVYAVYGTCLGISGGLASVPLIVRFSAASPEETEKAAARSAGAALAIGCIAGGLCLVAALFCRDPLRQALLALGIVLPGLILQDAWRQTFMARGVPRAAAVNDFAWLTLQAVGIGVLVAVDRVDLPLLLLVWGGAGTCAALLGVVQSRRWPSVGLAGRWLRENRDLGPRYALESVAHRAGPWLALALVGAVAGLLTVGALRGAMLLVLGPLNLLFIGATFVAGPESVRLAHRSLPRLRGVMVAFSAAVGVVALLWSLTLLLLAPVVGPTLLGDTWATARPLLPVLVLFAIALATSMGAMQGLLALGAARRSSNTQLAAVAVLSGCAAVGAAVGDAGGAAVGMVVASATFAVVRWWQFQLGFADARVARGPGRSADVAQTPKYSGTP